MSENTIRCCGVDVGTGFVASCEKDKEPGKVAFRKCRDCFFKLDSTQFMGGVAPQFAENMLKKQGAHFIKVNEEIYILGDSAFKFATTMRQDTLRPMAKGILNPKQKVSAKMVGEIIKAVAGKPSAPTDVLFYCIPAKPIDTDYDVEYHKQRLHQVFEEAGYKNITCIDEGLAVVFSELQEEGFTGMGISFGAGMVNLTFAMMGMPLLSFSISRGGDWIDEESAKATNEKASTITFKKEKGIDITNPKDEFEQAIAIHYKALLRYLVDNTKKMFAKGVDMHGNPLPMITEPITIVVAGGTSLAGGFIPTFEEIVKEGLSDVLPIGQIKKAEEPWYTCCHGLYQAAKLNSGS